MKSLKLDKFVQNEKNEWLDLLEDLVGGDIFVTCLKWSCYIGH